MRTTPKVLRVQVFRVELLSTTPTSLASEALLSACAWLTAASGDPEGSAMLQGWVGFLSVASSTTMEALLLSLKTVWKLSVSKVLLSLVAVPLPTTVGCRSLLLEVLSS